MAWNAFKVDKDYFSATKHNIVSYLASICHVNQMKEKQAAGRDRDVSEAGEWRDGDSEKSIKFFWNIK